MPSALVNLRVHELWNDLRVLTETHDLLERLWLVASEDSWADFLKSNMDTTEEAHELFWKLANKFGPERIGSIEASGNLARPAASVALQR